jgi:hypothetical protein
MSLRCISNCNESSRPYLDREKWKHRRMKCNEWRGELDEKAKLLSC